MGYFISVFPRGWAAIALLILRVVLGITVLLQAGVCLQVSGSGISTMLGLLQVGIGLLLVAGFLTPVAGLALGLELFALLFGRVPLCVAASFDSRQSIGFAIAITLAVVLLGPGAVSVDARIFGRRRVIIPGRASKKPT